MSDRQTTGILARMTHRESIRTEFESEALPHLDALFGLALRLTGGDEPRAEDLVQDTILKAYRSWDRFETGTNCRAWLMTILRNTFINEFRRLKSRPAAVEFEEIAERPPSDAMYEADPEGRIFERIIDTEVIAAIEELPDDFRIPIVLSDLEGLAYQEIADLLDIPVGTVKSRLFRARKRLQGRLYEYAVEMGFLR
ncbi:MAG: sigma-70 family RNA polymerase sigma factor [Gemmatimonadota bacterium]|nr:sigma-70 family RNA polymerase sigma factor [Gemmatimonadota bacterium]